MAFLSEQNVFSLVSMMYFYGFFRCIQKQLEEDFEVGAFDLKELTIWDDYLEQLQWEETSFDLICSDLSEYFQVCCSVQRIAL